ncbi:MAG: metallophosphoesterase [Chromatocurvus sp.]
MRRRHRCLARAWLVLCLLPALAWPQTEVEPYNWQGVARIVALGDIHGDYDNYLRALDEAQVIDRRQRWSAGRTHLVQLGDIPDRGPDTAKIIRHLQKLEQQAIRAGGRVHALVGNHEAMNMIGDLRYVHPGEYSALASRRAQALLENYYERVVAFRREQDAAYEPTGADREAWFAEHPQGFIEHRRHWHPEGEFGRWVLDHPAVLRINDTLFVHGGLSPALAGLPLETINNRIRDELANAGRGEQPLFLEREDGPLWYRGLATIEGGADENEVAALLRDYGVTRIVVGHTPGFGTVIPRFDGRVLLADSGIGSAYGGYVASVLIEGDTAYTVQEGTRIELPDHDSELLPYLRSIAQLLTTPAPNLLRLIETLEAEAEAEAEAEQPVDSAADLLSQLHKASEQWQMGGEFVRTLIRSESGCVRNLFSARLCHGDLVYGCLNSREFS